MCSQGQQEKNVFILHCGLDVRRVKRYCERLGLTLSITVFRKEEVFSYYIRLDRERPDLIIIRSHFRALVNDLNSHKHIPTIVVSTHGKPIDCRYPFLQTVDGYDGPASSEVYEQLALAMVRELHPKEKVPQRDEDR